MTHSSLKSYNGLDNNVSIFNEKSYIIMTFYQNSGEFNPSLTECLSVTSDLLQNH